MSRIRIASTSYLNALPISWGFLHGPAAPLYDISFHPPAVCAELLEAGKVAIALIPSIEFQSIPGLRILPGTAIGSIGRVGSVRLISKVPFESISSVAVDADSRTAVALLHILLRRRGVKNPKFTSMKVNLEGMLREHDAALIIGDSALRVRPGARVSFDLALEWKRETGLPFVFALWAARREIFSGLDIDSFLLSCRSGLGEIDRIARENRPGTDMDRSGIAAYLRDNIHYDLGGRELEGLRMFYRMAGEFGLIHSPRTVHLHRDPREKLSATEVQRGTG